MALPIKREYEKPYPSSSQIRSKLRNEIESDGIDDYFFKRNKTRMEYYSFSMDHQ